jgi:hypothetical protein
MDADHEPAGPRWPVWKEWLAVFLVLIVPHIAIFGSALIGRTYLYPLDLLALSRVYLPNTAEYRSIIPINPHLTDLILVYPANREFAAREYAAGRIPLWNPYNFLGAPSIPSAKYSPFEVPFYIWNSPVGIAWQQLMQGFVAGIGCYVFLRRVISVGILPALIGTSSYPWTGYFVLWQGYPLTHAAALLPWVLILTRGTVVRPASWCGPCLSVVTLFAVLSCPDVAGQVLLVSGCCAVFSWFCLYRRNWLARPLWISILATVAAWSLGLAACSLFAFPFVEYLRTGSRMQERLRGAEERPPVGVSMLPLTLLPDTYGSAKRTELQIIGGNQFESAASAYAGLLLSLFLVPLSWNSRRCRPWVLFFWFTAILGMSWQLDIPGFVQVLRLPVLNMMSHNRFVFATGFALIVLAAIGAEELISRDLKFRWWFLIPVSTGIVFSLWCLFRWAFLPGQLQSWIASGKLRAMSYIDVHAALQSCALCHARGLILAVTASLCWLFIGRSQIVRIRGLWIIGVLALIEVVSFASRENRQSDPTLYFPQIPALAALKNHPAGRVMGLGCLPPLLNVWHGLSDVRGYDAVDPKAVLDLLQIACDPKVKSPSYARTQWAMPKITQTAEGSKRASPIFDMLNVRYFITRSDPPAGFPVLIHDDDYWIVENTHALQRVFVPATLTRLPSAEEVLNQLSSPTFDPQAKAYTTEEIPAEFPIEISGKAVVIAENPQHVEIDAKMETDGVIILSDLWDSGWSAEVDGEATRIRRVNHCLRAIDLHSGMHRIVMRYEPQSFRRGMWTSCVAIAAMMIWCGASLIGARKHCE